MSIFGVRMTGDISSINFKRLKKNLALECPVCLEDIRQARDVQCCDVCSASFHYACAEEWDAVRCPVCRASWAREFPLQTPERILEELEENWKKIWRRQADPTRLVDVLVRSLNATLHAIHTPDAPEVNLPPGEGGYITHADIEGTAGIILTIDTACSENNAEFQWSLINLDERDLLESDSVAIDVVNMRVTEGAVQAALRRSIINAIQEIQNWPGV